MNEAIVKPQKKKRTPKNAANNVHQDFLGEVDMTPRVNRSELSQWFTPPGIAARMARWAAEALPNTLGTRILEPAGGAGALVRAMVDAWPWCANIDVHEIDPVHTLILRRFAEEHCDTDEIVVFEGDFLTAIRRERMYDVALMNPPYEGGLDGLFLEACMTVSNAVVILIRSAALHGSERGRRIWKRCQPGGEWVVTRCAHLIDRPDFEGSGAVKATEGAKSEFSVVQMRRRRDTDPVHVPTLLEWW